MKYECPECGKKMSRGKRKRALVGFCSKTGKNVVLRKIMTPDPAGGALKSALMRRTHHRDSSRV